MKNLFVFTLLVFSCLFSLAQPRVDSVWHATQYIDSSIVEWGGTYTRCQMETWSDSEGNTLGYIHDTGLLEAFVSRDTIRGTEMLELSSWTAQRIENMGKDWILYKMGGTQEYRTLLYSDDTHMNVEFVFPSSSTPTFFTGPIVENYKGCDWVILDSQDNQYCLKNGWIRKAIAEAKKGKPFVIK